MLIDTVEIMQNNTVAESWKASKPENRVTFTRQVEVEKSGWISVQVRAKYGRDPIRRPFPFAATMPVWTIVDGKAVRSRADAEHFIQWMDRTLERAMASGSFNNDAERAETRKLYGEARSRMAQRAGEDR